MNKSNTTLQSKKFFMPFTSEDVYLDGLNVLEIAELKTEQNTYSFFEAKHILRHLEYHTYIREVTLPWSDSTLTITHINTCNPYNKYLYPDSWKANRVILGHKLSLCEIETYEYLKSLGVSLGSFLSNIIKHAVKFNNINLFHYALNNILKPLNIEFIPIDYIISRGSVKIISLLISNGIDIEEIICHVIKNSRLDLVKFCVESNYTNCILNKYQLNYMTNLAAQYASGNMDIMKYLLSIGANIRCDNDCPLRMAVIGPNNLQMIKFIIDCGANIHSEDNDALKKACANTNLELVEYLVSIGADIHANNDEPFKIAIKNENWDIAKYLIEQGISVNGDHLVNACRRANNEFIIFLIKRGLDINYNNGEPLRQAILWNRFEVAELLVELGVDVSLCGPLPTFGQMYYTDPKFVKYLKKLGIKMIVNETGPSKLMGLIEYGISAGTVIGLSLSVYQYIIKPLLK